ncbi:patatin-like phospholipase family protein [Rubrivivax benzoatilyticus]|uniref:Patatin family protein n=1 Tax=Rubrivivax benzoatilyticus TaxID=316997 RepID=A0ABX0HTT6_9BURK|nr:patatin-like phospholipase family protein [Rubrivivax benzoatilyticus]EGJ10029.1 patatin [Rubrivivax benzoatilyticus JA2 = ATCC BAA-35]NHK97189.1 patatin family protein [Rubrivivax benzoatilyticus]NHL23116.1 patatin family protein [Rubrivivax benzoatilyticus]
MTTPDSKRIGLALAGGGPLGAIYEIGALCALDESFVGVDFTRLDGYVGVSAGGFIAAGLANGITPRQLCTSFILNQGPDDDVIRPGLFVQPAWREYGRRLAMLPALVAHAAWDYAFERRSLLTALERLGRALPAGLFGHEALERQVARMLSAPGRSNDFRQVARPLVIVATDLDSGQSAPFGRPGWEHVPISRAVAASAALPGLFPPVPIDGRCYVDGALKKTLHARVLLDMDMDLVLCLNPLVPFESGHVGRHATPTARAGQRIPRLADGGLPVVLSQTFRTLIHSRLELGMRGYEQTHPGTEIVLFEPDQRDPEMFLANTFGYSQRRAMAEHAYQQTRADLRARRDELAPRLAAHGIRLDDAALDDETRRLVPLKRRRRPARGATAKAMRRLDEVLDDLERRLAAAR